MQHIAWQLADTGIAVEVHNGSTLFSGDAGGGESNIRKYFFDKDWVEAIIQMPSDEFFNTGIYTYLWILNKNKAVERKDKVMLINGDAGGGESNIRKYFFDKDWVEAIIQMPSDEFFNTGIYTYLWILNKNKAVERKDKVMLINGANGWKLLKKSKGNKRREMLPEHRAMIVDALTKFEDCEIGKVYDKWHFYYNKQSVVLTDVDDSGNSVLSTICADNKPYKVNAVKAVLNGAEICEFSDMNPDLAVETFNTLKAYDPMQDDLLVIDNEGNSYAYNPDSCCFFVEDKAGKTRALGCGKWVFKLSHSKKTGKSAIQCSIDASYINDFEIVRYSPNELENESIIDDFLKKYVYRPYVKKDNTVGVELNFNKEFYVPEEIESVDQILADIADLEKALNDIRLKF